MNSETDGKLGVGITAQQTLAHKQAPICAVRPSRNAADLRSKSRCSAKLIYRCNQLNPHNLRTETPVNCPYTAMWEIDSLWGVCQRVV